MAATYLKRIRLVDADAEWGTVQGIQRSCYNSVYPYKIFPDKELSSVTFEPITLFYGGNGSGKSTLLNIIAEKTGVKRHGRFNRSAFFDDYVKKCEIDARYIPDGSQIITSDDVFDYLIDLRTLNDGVDNRREELFQDWIVRKYAEETNPLKSLEDFDEWKENNEARHRTQSRYVNERLSKNPEMHSNGESAMHYFTNRIDMKAIYLLDEPENSLSIGLQQELAEFIVSSARYFECQFIIATHSPILLSMQDALIYDLDSCPVTTKKWTELENVRKYYEFFELHRSEFAE